MMKISFSPFFCHFSFQSLYFFLVDSLKKLLTLHFLHLRRIRLIFLLPPSSDHLASELLSYLLLYLVPFALLLPFLLSLSCWQSSAQADPAP